MDRYEWPNREGVHPDVMITFEEADSLCRGRGRRLCTEREWTFACEGERMLPYPYGYDRDPYACTIDHWARAPERALLHSATAAMEEAARVYEASASGTMTRCRSPFGAMDLTGNVDEWVMNESGWPYPSSLMGGFWGHVRTRCRAVTRGHGPNFRYYQIGFRCCDDEGEHSGADRGIVATTP
jgi:formylglycine-generating enzyme required for sulfatase activity